MGQPMYPPGPDGPGADFSWWQDPLKTLWDPTLQPDYDWSHALKPVRPSDEQQIIFAAEDIQNRRMRDLTNQSKKF